ncbi:hypothetical protein DL96DRAFT_1591163 [Flagelloscypha sp. PMI_526]|nr:hypothetical protein DL96DRAFT_1591163 [Flagelloscypha sp. PMI_526]
MTILPLELYEKIFLLTDDFETWKSCSRVCRAFRASNQALLFERTDALRLLDQHPRKKVQHLYPHVRRVRLIVDILSRRKLGLEVKSFLARLSNLHSLEFVASVIGVPWARTGILGVSMLRSEFFQVTTLRVHNLEQMPLLALLSALPNLKHLTIGWFEAIPSEKLGSRLLRMPQLQSLNTDTVYWENFLPSAPLMQAIDLCGKTLASITLHGGNNGMAFLYHADNLLCRCAKTLTHLHIGPLIFKDVVHAEGNPDDSLPLAELRHLKILQFELSHKFAERSFWSVGHLFSTWLARELSKMPSPSALSQIVCDVAQFYRDVSRGEIQMWPELDRLLTSNDAYPDLAEFRWRLDEPGNGVIMGFASRLQTVLPLCTRRRIVTVETWNDRWELVDSIVQESCH